MPGVEAVLAGPVILVGLAAGAAAVWLHRRSQNRASLARILEDLARLGWPLQGSEVQTPVGPLRIGFRSRGLDEPRADLVLQAELPPSCALQITFGDPYWDILGEPALAAGLATGLLRSSVSPTTQLHVDEGNVGLYAVAPDRVTQAAIALEELTQRFRKALQTPETKLAQLLHPIAASDPDPAARAGAVPHLLDLHPELAEALSQDPAPSVRFAVAYSIGGFAGLELSRDILGRDLLEPAVQRSVIRWIAEAYPPTQVAPVLAEALPRVTDSVAVDLVAALSRLGNPQVIGALKKELPTAQVSTAIRIVEALVQLDGPGAEAELLQIAHRVPKPPTHVEEQDLLTAIADGLAQVGSREALPTLSRFATLVEPTSAPGLSVKVAIDLVLTRLGEGPGHGSLSTVPEDGTLSEVQECSN